MEQVYKSCFDQIKNTVIQSKRKIIQSRKILNFNSDKLQKLNSDIKELSSISEELVIIDKLNENLLDIAIFMKKELFLQCSKIFLKVKKEMEMLKEKGEENVSLIYFEKVVNKKQEEFFYQIREKLFSIIFDVFIEKYNKDYFMIFDQQLEEDGLEFETETFNFKYFEDFIQNFKIDQKNYFDKKTLNVETFNQKIFKLDQMIDLYFDSSVFDFFNKELDSTSNIHQIEDFKIIEILKSAKQTGLIQTLLKDLIEGIDFKLNQYLLKFSKFLIYIFKNTNDIMQYKSNLQNEWTKNYFILADLEDITFCEIFINCLMKLIIMQWQKYAFMFKIYSEFDRNVFNKIFERFFYNLKIYIENIFFQKDMITKYNEEYFQMSQILKKKFKLNHSHVFILLNKINPHFKYLIKQFCTFIDQPEKTKIVEIHFESFEDSLFLKFKMKIQQVYDQSIKGSSENFVKFEKTKELDINSKQIFQNNTDMTKIVKSSLKTNSKFFEGLTSKKYSIEIIDNFNKYCLDMNFFLQTHLVQNNFICKQFLQFYNKALMDIFKVVDRFIIQNEEYNNVLQYKSEPYFRQNLKKIKSSIFSDISAKNFTKSKLASFLQTEHTFDYNKLEMKKFWETQSNIEFYEKCLICFYEFKQNEKFFVQYLLTMWKYLDVDLLNKISVHLNTTFELLDAKSDLKNAKKAILRSRKYEHIINKLKAGVDLSFEENIILLIHYYFKFKTLIMDLLFYLKLNFDFLIFSFFQESSESVNKFKEHDKKFFNTSAQIFEFKKLVLSYNKMTSNYINSPELKKYFVLNTLDTFYKCFHKFIFEIKPVFIDNKKYIKNYYIEFSRILCEMNIFEFYHKEIKEKSSNYKFMKKLLTAEDEEEVLEIGIDYGLEDNADELDLAKESILFYSTLPKEL